MQSLTFVCLWLFWSHFLKNEILFYKSDLNLVDGCTNSHVDIFINQWNLWVKFNVYFSLILAGWKMYNIWILFKWDLFGCQVFVYLHKKATIVDTRTSLPGYMFTRTPDSDEFPVRHYNFSTLEDVEKYWSELMDICLSTSLGRHVGQLVFTH